MRYKQSELYYWNTSVSPNRWTQALTHNVTNAVIDVQVFDAIGNPRKLGITLSNVPKDFTSSNATDQTGALSAAFTDYQIIMMRDGQTHQITFSGRIYKIEKKFNPAYGGNTIYLEAFDALAELRDYSTKALKNTSSDEWDKYELSGKKRSAVIEELINFGIGQGKQDGSSNYFLSDGSQNLNSTDRVSTGSGTRFRFEESTVTIPAQSDENLKEWFRPKRVDGTLLEIISDLANEDPHTNNDRDKSHGYNYYVDAGMAVPKPTGGNWTSNPPSILNYFKRGTRPTNAPVTLGLKCAFGSGFTTADADPNASPVRPATKIMFPSYDFNKPSQELYTHAIVTYNGYAEKGQELRVTSNMEVLYVSNLNSVTVGGEPFFKGNDLYYHEDDPNDKKSPPAQLWWRNSSGTWANTTAFAHSQSATSSGSVTSNSTVLDYESVVIGVPIENQSTFEDQIDTMQSDGSNAGILLGVKVWDGTGYGGSVLEWCRFNSTTKYLGKGRARTAFGINRPQAIDITDLPTESSRNRIKSALVRTNMDLRRGEFTFAGAPFYSVNLKVKDVTSNAYQFETPSGTSLVDLTTLGCKEGFTIQNFGDSDTYADEILNNAKQPSFGYIYSMPNVNTIVANWTHTAPSEGDYVQLHIPLRAGDYIRVENPQEQIAGNHIITQINFEERMGSVQTSVKTVGRNEDVALTTSLNIDSSVLRTSITKAKDASQWGLNSDTLPMGQQSFRLHDITFTRNSQTLISWTAGKLEVGGRYYSIVAGNTTSTNGNNALQPTIQSGYTYPQQYYIYFNKDVSTTAFKTSPVVRHSSSYGTEYVPDGDDVLIAIVRAGVDSDQNALIWKYGENPKEISSLDTYKNDPSAFIANNSTTTALLKKGAQPFTTSVQFHRYPNSSSSVYNAVGWTSGAISFGESETDTTNISSGQVTGLTASTTYYLYYTIGGSTITHSSDYRVPFQDDKVLLATVVVGSNPGVTNYTPTILPFNGKQPTISAVGIAANSITADNITSGTITTGELDFVPNTDTTSAIRAGTTKANVGLGNVDNTSDSSVLASAASAANSADKTGGTVGAWALNSSHIYSPSGTTPVTSGYTAGNGHISLNSAGSIHTPKFYVNTDGTAQFKGEVSVGNGSVTINDAGIRITSDSASTDYIRFSQNNHGNMISQLYTFVGHPDVGPTGFKISTAEDMHISIGTEGQSTNHTTRVINFNSDYISILPNGEAASTRQYYKFPTDTAAAGDALVVDSVTSNVASVYGSGTTSSNAKDVVNLKWHPAGSAGVNAFETVAVLGQNNIVADASDDTLTITAGTGINITTNSTTDAITFESSIYGTGGQTWGGGYNYVKSYETAGTGTGQYMEFRSRGSYGQPRLRLWANSSTAGQYGSELAFIRSKSSSSLSGTTALADNDDLGQLNYYGFTSNGGQTLMGQITTIQAGSAPGGSLAPGSRFYIRSSKASSGVGSGVDGAYQFVLDEAYGTGIGTVAKSVNPYFKMVVAGHNNYSGNYCELGGASTYHALYIVGTALAVSWNTTSDARLKDDMTTITGSQALTALNALNPITYKWNDAYYSTLDSATVSQTDAGFKSTEFANVFPAQRIKSKIDLIKNDTTNEYRTGTEVEEGETKVIENIEDVDTAVIIPYLVAAVNNLEARIKTLEG